MAASLFLALLSLPAAAPVAAGQGSPAVDAAWGEFAARGQDLTLAWPELDALLVSRHALSEEGRAALKHLVRARLLDRLARDSKLEIGPAEVEARWQELEAQMRSSGQAQSLSAYLEGQGVDREVFQEFLRLGIVQERLSRRALGIPEGRPVPGDQQEMWLDQVIEQRGTEMPAPPWPDGVVAHCGDLSVSERDYTQFLRTQLSAELVRDACYQLLLEKRARARMPDLSPAALSAAIEVELARRRAEVAGDPKYKGLSYEQVLGAQGLSLAGVTADPAVVCAALAHLWVDRSAGEDGLRAAYQAERETFDGLFGEAREVRALYLRGAVFENQLNPRTIARAEAELSELAERIGGQQDFERLARERSEDPGTREAGGLLGFVPRGDERVPAPIREAAFSNTGRALEGGRLVGPVRLPGGAALLWIGARRPAPGWDVMRSEVHRELRRRFLEECLPRQSVVTYLDA